MPQRTNRDGPEYEWVGFNATGADYSYEAGDASAAGIMSPGDGSLAADLYNTDIQNIADFTNFIRVICTVFVNPASSPSEATQIESLITVRHVDASSYAGSNYWTDPDELGDDDIIGYDANSLRIPGGQTVVDDEPTAKLHMDVSSTRVVENTDAIVLEYCNSGNSTVTLNVVGRALFRKD